LITIRPLENAQLKMVRIVENGSHGICVLIAEAARARWGAGAMHRWR
jgi:hypothetical protein